MAISQASQSSILLHRLVILAISSIFVSSQVQAEEKWNELFGAGALAKNWTTTGNWKIDDKGVASLTPRPGEEGWKRFDAYLWSKKQYSNFEAEFDYQVPKEGNSGFFFHVSDLKSPVEHGIEVQIYDSHGQSQSTLTDHDSGGLIPGSPPTKNAAKPASEWNHFYIVVEDNLIRVELNGEKVNEVQPDLTKLKDRDTKGYIGFQDEGRPLLLRNLKIREFD